MKVSANTDAFILAYGQVPARKPVDPEEPKISVQTTISWLSFAYEKFRNVVDYQQDHLLRKNAIARFLKRRIYTEGAKTDFARLLLTELIQAGYLPNHTIPERTIGELEPIIGRYLQLIPSLAPNLLLKSSREAADWLLSVCAVELEQTIVEHSREMILADYVYRTIRQDCDVSKDIEDPKEQDLQIYLAIHRSLIRADTGMLRHLLLTIAIPNWFHNDPEAIATLQRDFLHIVGHIEEQLNHPIASQLQRFVRRFSVLFIVIRDVADAYGNNVRSLLDDPEDFRDQVRRAYQKRFVAAQGRIRRGYIRMVLYVFITKMLIALLLELPYDFYISQTKNYTPLFINIGFHPFLMLLIALFIDPPSRRNTDRVVTLVEKIVREDPHPDFLYRAPRRFARNAFFTGLVRMLSVVTFFGSFALIVWVLRQLHFQVISVGIFLFFLTIVSFLGMKLRSDVREFVVLRRRANLFTVLFDFFTVPLLQVGRWILEKAPKINVFLFILDVIIEAPFKFFVELFEEWGALQREKKEELY